MRLRDPAVRARLKAELARQRFRIRTAARTMINDVVADSLRSMKGAFDGCGKLR